MLVKSENEIGRDKPNSPFKVLGFELLLWMGFVKVHTEREREREREKLQLIDTSENTN